MESDVSVQKQFDKDAALRHLLSYVPEKRISHWVNRVAEPISPAPYKTKRADSEIEKRRASLEDVCDVVSTLLGVVQVDRTGHPAKLLHLHGNTALAKYLAVSTDDLENKAVNTLGAAEDFLVAFHRAVNECVYSGFATFEHGASAFLTRPQNASAVSSGEIFWAKVSLWRLASHGINDETQIAYAIEDISSYRTIEAALLANHHFYERIAAATPHIWYVFDLMEQRNVYANREIAELLGFDANEIREMGASLMPTIIHPDDLPQVIARFSELTSLADGEVSRFEFRVRRKDGAYRWLETHEVPFARDNATELVQQMLGVSLDITERRDTVDALARSEGYLRLAMESANIGTFVCDFARGIVELSPDTRRHMGLDASQETLTLSEMSELVYSEDRPLFAAAMNDALSNHAPFHAEYRARHPSGELRWGSIKAQVTFDETTGAPLHMIGVCADIEDRKRFEAQQSEEVHRQGRIVQALQSSILSVAPQGGRFQPGKRGGSITLGAADTADHWDVALLYEPAWDESQVGGDFYDIFAVDTERTAFVIGDVSGKGLGAAESVAEIKFGLRSVLRGISADPSFALRYLNDRQVEAQELDGRSRELLFAVTIVVADNETGVVQIARAGAESPLICRRDANGVLLRAVSDVGDLPIGALPETQ